MTAASNGAVVALPKPRLTTIQKKMLVVLSDGQRHTRYELHGCLYDNLGPVSNIEHHIGRLRKILLPYGQTIVCEFYKKRWYYRHIILLTPQVSVLS